MNKPPTAPKFVILLSGVGSNCRAIIDACQTKAIPAQVTAVVSDKPKAPGLLWAAQQPDLTTVAIDRIQYTDNAAFQAALCATLQSLAPDLIILAGFMRILSPEIIQAFPNRIINIHPALLPEFPGLNTHARVLAAQHKYHGSTVHVVTEALDAGPILAQARLNIHPSDTVSTLTERVKHLEHQLYPRVLKWLAVGDICLEKHGVYYLGDLLTPRGLQMIYTDHWKGKQTVPGVLARS